MRCLHQGQRRPQKARKKGRKCHGQQQLKAKENLFPTGREVRRVRRNHQLNPEALAVHGGNPSPNTIGDLNANGEN